MFLIARGLVFVVFLLAGYLVGLNYGYVPIGIIGGLILAAITFVSEKIMEKIPPGTIIGGLFGLLLGILFANLMLLPVKAFLGVKLETVSFAINALFGYGGLLIGLSKGKDMTVASIVRMFKGQSVDEDLKILDTSVIIDGRIADICEAGFIEGIFVIPQFILQELQYIADSADSLKRARGRRGLDILQRIQKMSRVTVRIIDEDFPKIKEVDSKLVALAKLFSAKIITNDLNLNKIAQLQGVAVMNINELASAIKPVVMPGEIMKVFVLKEGKEYNQGVAYLDDGTMVVVESGRKVIGKNIDVAVTSVLQTTAGRMIFAKTKEDYEKEEKH